MQRQCRLANGLIAFGYGNALRRNRDPEGAESYPTTACRGGRGNKAIPARLAEEDPTSVVKEVT
jgi:hypothetical protein